MRRGRAALVAATALAGLAAFLFGVAPAGPRSLRAFEPDRVADLELDMWQAYYAKDDLRLFRGLLTLLHEQNRYTWAKAGEAAFHLARAAARFGNLREGYDTVLPDLERAYAIQAAWADEAFDPAAVARAELAWWVARRVPGRNSPEQIGRLIAEENALLYGVPVSRVLDASTLRARAGRLRDDGGARADWALVGRLLHESYRALFAAVNDNEVK
jgi:hypothetical protein